MDSTLACLARWMPRQRWYAAKGRTPHLRYVASWDLPTPEPDARVRTLLVADEGTLPVLTYQVPLVVRSTASVPAALSPHVIGHPDPGTTLIDGPHDPAYATALLSLVTRGGAVRGSRGTATGHPLSGAPAAAVAASSSVLTGEQSNTSLIYRFEGEAAPVICKVYRQAQHGQNPDVELNIALSDIGSPHVPRAVGWIEGVWPAASGTGALAFAQRYFPDVDDAWRVALRAAAAGDDFGRPAFDLGAATADVHRSLAHLFATRDAAPVDRAAMRDAWQRRLSTAVAEVAGLSQSRRAIEAVYDRALDAPWPPLQRIHGDYHLGQVIRVPDRGWVLLDFEGEPLRPMAERVQPDLALRDVAGMLRSFEYVAGSIRLDHPEGSLAVREWATTARRSFLAGYADRAGPRTPITGPLLDALELDKAVYEAIYESRSRPAWVVIPVQAIERLIAVAPPGAAQSASSSSASS